MEAKKEIVATQRSITELEMQLNKPTKDFNCAYFNYNVLTLENLDINFLKFSLIH